ncbi:hypothetical protein TGAM01_v209060 [Trichoderma gamsii]|uniref:Uncharacterized protein n=1 Tax=Trichoderma gamsii TaxID=398673 RepID=A0A2P4ZCH8_9HYPO|nr:hypothetical protein TGAM01_v209060 [Trichoderma gamsii]PON21990.1 hypothetical protein TGAM01_v209060 [Trichoderma gamsii]
MVMVVLKVLLVRQDLPAQVPLPVRAAIETKELIPERCNLADSRTAEPKRRIPYAPLRVMARAHVAVPAISPLAFTQRVGNLTARDDASAVSRPVVILPRLVQDAVCGCSGAVATGSNDISTTRSGGLQGQLS